MTVDWDREIEQIRASRAASPRLGPGARPAVVVVDFQRAFMENEDPRAAEALAATTTLLRAARDARAPIFYTATSVDSLDDVNVTWRALQDLRPFLRGSPASEIDPRVRMEWGDILVEKPHASAFFGTHFAQRLTGLGVDTLLLAGTSTSGCVRATAVDACAHSYRVTVVEDCCYDPRLVSREAALWDLADRYADVVRLDEVVEYLASRGSAST